MSLAFLQSLIIYNETYYLIPDGYGKWKKTDPRKDRDRVSSINTAHKGNVLNVIRIMKYWNRRPTMPSMSPYLIETMIVNHYENRYGIATSYVDIEIPDIFKYISINIFSNVNDHKGIQGNINTLDYNEMVKISERAILDYKKALEARIYENNNNYEASIKKWAEVFGPSFPSYSL